MIQKNPTSPHQTSSNSYPTSMHTHQAILRTFLHVLLAGLQTQEKNSQSASNPPSDLLSSTSTCRFWHGLRPMSGFSTVEVSFGSIWWKRQDFPDHATRHAPLVSFYSINPALIRHINNISAGDDTTLFRVSPKMGRIRCLRSFLTTPRKTQQQHPSSIHAIITSLLHHQPYKIIGVRLILVEFWWS